MTTDLTLHADLGDDDLRAEWAALVADDPHGTIFQHPRYVTTWARTLAGDSDVSTLALRRDGDLVGLVVEAIEAGPDGATTVRLAGGTEVTDYRAPVARPDATKDLATAWAQHLVELDVDRVDLSGMPADTGWPDLLATALESAGADDVTRVVHDVAPVVDLSAGHEAWEAGLDGRDRKELRRKARKLARDLGGMDVVEVPAEELDDALGRFFAMNDGADDDKASFFDRPDMQAWFRALADEFRGDHTFRLHELRVAGNAVAANVSLVWGDHWGLYNSAFNPRLAAFSPGNVLVGELIALAADEGVAMFDLLRGDEDYKYRFGAVDREVEQVTARPAGGATG
jgi:CelD/BcsL family acetyltransferase involved in cellulose biosynthesis